MRLALRIMFAASGLAVAMAIAAPAGAVETTSGLAGWATAATRASSGVSAVALPASSPSIDGRCTGTVLRYGSSGSCVWLLQVNLNQLFGAGLAADSSYGPATTTAVRNFQKRYGLGVDGIVGPKTWSQLEWCEYRFLNGLSY
ncbi:MAG: peptidoglycan-binding protein [Cellulomonadaceae bacterium]|nr:peptidoglycan-binding protein [Cellulomonadaceae bacterium]